MTKLPLDHLVLRYCRRIIMKTVDHVRGAMRGEDRLRLKCSIAGPHLQKSKQNLTKAIDQEAEDLILDALQCKLAKLPKVRAYPVLSGELGIKTCPELDFVHFEMPRTGLSWKPKVHCRACPSI
jgi:hypothetical protein